MSILEGRGRSEGSLQTEFLQNVKQISNLKALSALSHAKVSWDDTCLTGKEGGFQPLLLIHRIVAARVRARHGNIQEDASRGNVACVSKNVLSLRTFMTTTITFIFFF